MCQQATAKTLCGFRKLFKWQLIKTIAWFKYLSHHFLHLAYYSWSMMEFVKYYWNKFYFYIFDHLILYPLMKILPSKFDVQFMNLGYIPRAESRDNLQLVHEILGPEEGIHAHVNLYEKALSLCPGYPNLKDYKLLEVGCGLSGGIKWILQSHLEIDSIIGVDRVVGDSLNGLVKYSDAHNLDFPDKTFDLVINIESSHLYTYPERFFKEIWRVLKPNGYFCWADLRLTNEIDSTLQSVYGSGLRLITYQNITKQVINGINNTSQRYDQMIDQAPWYIKWFKNSIRTTYCAPGTESYQRFLAGEKVYAVACWQKVIKS